MSEIVVPMTDGVRPTRLVGEIDVDSDRRGAFGPGDVAFLDHVARMLSSRCRA